MGRLTGLCCVIVTYNSLEVIESCLTSLLESGIKPFQIHIVDNGSTDGTVSLVSQSYPEIRITESSENLGFSKANNLGARESSSRLIMFANPDTIFLPGAVERMVEALDSSEAGICGPLILDRNLHPKPESYLPPPSVPGLFLLQTHLWKPVYLARRFLDRVLRPTSPRERRVLSGSCMLVSRETFLKVGGFDERFFMYAEDLDLCESISRAGFEVVQAPAARMIHLGGSTYAVSRTVLFNSLRARDILSLKHSGFFSLVAKRLLVVLGLSLRLAAYKMLQRAGFERHEDLIASLHEGLRCFLSPKLLRREQLNFPER